MIRLWLSFVLMLLTLQLIGQTKITGTIKSSLTQDPVYDVAVTLVETGQSVKSDRIGYFQFVDLTPGTYTLRISHVGYENFDEKVEAKDGETLELGELYLTYDPQSVNVGVITLTADELASDESSSQSSVGLLQSSQDVFVQTAAFELGAFWFRTRGYDNKTSEVLFNGVRMNKVDNGRVDFGNWGGLNDVTRYPTEVAYGLEPSDYSFGDLGGVTYFDTRPSTMRAGTRASYSLTNRSYRQRVMFTHNTGLNEKGWGFMFSGSRRWAEEGRVEGTFYDAWAYYLGAEKKFNEQHTLNLTLMGSPYRRSTGSPNTQEVFDMMGTDYNAFWGYQDGEKRSERVRKSHEPMAQLTHHWNFNKNSKLTTTVAYQTGKASASRLDWFNAPNPSPLYYRKLPSYYEYVGRTEEDIAYVRDQWRNNPNYSQINWAQLYQANRNQGDGAAVYYLLSDVNEDDILSFNSTLRSQLYEDLTIYAGVNYQGTKSEIYRELNDLLGGNYVLDVDDFADPGVAGDFDTNNPNRRVMVGDKLQYNAIYTHNYMNAWFSGLWKLGSLDVTVGAKLSNTSIQREGKFANYNYDNSYGKSERYDFLDYGAKLQLQYKLDGRNFIIANGAYFTNAPDINDVFPQGRDNNATIPNLESAKFLSGDLSYVLRAPRIKARATGFFTKSQDEVDVAFGYLELSTTSGSDNNIFTAEVVSGVDKQYLGAEIAVDAQLTTTISAQAVASIGQYTYANNPDLYYFSEQFADQGGYVNRGTTYLKDYKLSGTPQAGYSVGLEYRDPKYWWIGATANYLANNYVDVVASRRTEGFLQDDNGRPYDGLTESDIRSVLKQEKLSDEFMLNASAGKSFRFGDYYLVVSLNVNNVLDNRNYRTSGFEQLRLANYAVLTDSNYSTVFGNRYWYDQGLSYFLNVILRF